MSESLNIDLRQFDVRFPPNLRLLVVPHQRFQFCDLFVREPQVFGMMDQTLERMTDILMQTAFLLAMQSL